MEHLPNLAEALWGMLGDCNLDRRTVINHVFSVSPTTFYKFVTGQKEMPRHWEPACRHLLTIFDKAYQDGKLPISRQELLWNGIVHTCECNDVSIL